MVLKGRSVEIALCKCQTEAYMRAHKVTQICRQPNTPSSPVAFYVLGFTISERWREHGHLVACGRLGGALRACVSGTAVGGWAHRRRRDKIDVWLWAEKQKHTEKSRSHEQHRDDRDRTWNEGEIRKQKRDRHLCLMPGVLFFFLLYWLYTKSRQSISGIDIEVTGLETL